MIKLLKLNGVETILEVISTNEKMCQYLLCEKSIRCILGHCENCKNFGKLRALVTDDLKCSKECRKKNDNCVELGHTIKVRQFEKVMYKHKGKDKKKIALVDKTCRSTIL